MCKHARVVIVEDLELAFTLLYCEPTYISYHTSRSFKSDYVHKVYMEQNLLHNYAIDIYVH